jgi:hypothetical protein
MKFQCIVDRVQYNVHVNMFKFVKFAYHKVYNEFKVMKVGLLSSPIRGTNIQLIKRTLKHFNTINIFLC